MTQAIDGFDEIKKDFLQEAEQLLSDAEQCFLSLEKNSDDPKILEKLFRLAHNFKGSGNAVGFTELGRFTHQLESLLSRLRSKEVALEPAVVDLLLRCNDHLVLFIEALKADLNAKVDSSALLEELQAAAEQALSQPMPKAENPIPSEPTASSAPAPVTGALAPLVAPSAPASAGGPPENTGIRVSLNRLNQLLNYAGEMVILQSVLREHATGEMSPLVRRTIHQLGKVSKEVQDIAMSLRMVPMRPLFQKLQRVIRDTAKALGKEVLLECGGEDTQLDKIVLDQLGDPLVHLVRNAIDHGIEAPNVRAELSKPMAGAVKLSAFHKAGQVMIEVSDDGKGLDAAKLVSKAIQKGLLRPDARLSDEEAHQLIFAPGFSTKEVVTDVSGRGVGMDVVRTNIEKLQGTVHIETAVNQGTTFRIMLPLTLAIIDAMIVRSGNERYVIPLHHVFETLQSGEMQVRPVSGSGKVLLLREENIPLYRLSALVGHAQGRTSEESAPAAGQGSQSDECALVIRAKNQAFAVLVDQILSQQQVVIKPLGPEIQHIKGCPGGAILGDGLPAVILELPELVRKIAGGRPAYSNERRISA